MCAITRGSQMPLRSCCRTFSGKTGILAASCMALRVFPSAPRSCLKSFSRWQRDGGSSAFDFLSDDVGPGTLHLLQGGGAQRCADSAVATRPSLFLADVRASHRAAFRSLSPCGTGLPRFWTQRVARSEAVRLHVRPLRASHEP